jgi:hypothetical protein
MTNTPSTNAQHQGSTISPQKREWKKPVLDILALTDAQHGHAVVHDGFTKHKSG